MTFVTNRKINSESKFNKRTKAVAILIYTPPICTNDPTSKLKLEHKQAIASKHNTVSVERSHAYMKSSERFPSVAFAGAGASKSTSS